MDHEILSTLELLFYISPFFVISIYLIVFDRGERIE